MSPSICIADSLLIHDDDSLPVVAAAIHAGHALRAEVAGWSGLDSATRLREEDPFTEEIAACCPGRIVALRSRFAFDLNRPPERAVYRTPDDAWGLSVWRAEPPADVLARSRHRYDACYEAMGGFLQRLADRHGRFVVLDIHSYNHRRSGPDASPADPQANPQVNIGTAGVGESFRPGLVRFADGLRERGAGIPGTGSGPLDVRIDVKFQGGHFVRWIRETFAGQGCGVAIEIKKTFMDEWACRPDAVAVSAWRDCLAAAAGQWADALRGRGG